MRLPRSTVRATLLAGALGLAVALSASPALAVGEEITDVRVHGNLFGRGKQLLIGGKIATVDSGAALAYRDPSFFGSWIYWQVQGNVQRQNIPEYSPQD